jgi:hypothetical protein
MRRAPARTSSKSRLDRSCASGRLSPLRTFPRDRPGSRKRLGFKKRGFKKRLRHSWYLLQYDVLDFTEF